MSVPVIELQARAWLRTVGRPGPERWVWPVVALGWIVLTAPVWGRLFAGHAPVHEHHTGTGSMDGPARIAMEGPTGSSWWSELAAHLLMWTAMVLATMLPLVAWNLRRVGLRSPHGRRTAATIDVAVGWVAVWLVTGLAGSIAVLTATRAWGPGIVLTASVAVAVAWQFAPARRVAVARCHRTFAPPLGRTRRRLCVRFGGTLGRDCVVSCWAAMVVMTAAGHLLVAVVPLAWLSWRDRRRPHDRPGTTVSVAVEALVGLVVVLVPGVW